MRSMLIAGAALALACAGAPGDSTRGEAARRPAAGAVDDARLLAAADEPESWLTYGGSYAEQRFSRLEQIHDGNVGDLGLAWWLDLGTRRGVEATPIVVDGVIYTTGTWSVVFAVGARTGKLLWRHDPEVPREYGGRVCCDVVNRGVAVYRGRVYVGTLDGRLQALDARTGEVVWSVVTVDQSRPYSITMAPRVVKGRVIIGNGGAELGVRGYVSDDGEPLWETPVGTGIVAAPVTYSLDGRQYVAVMSGWGGAFPLGGGDAAAAAGVKREHNDGRLLVFTLGGGAELPAQRDVERELAALPAGFDPEQVLRGNQTYHRWCAVCHGLGVVGGGVLPDLRRSAPAVYEALDAIVLEGARLPAGMPSFAAFLEPGDVDDLRAYLLTRRAALTAGGAAP